MITSADVHILDVNSEFFGVPTKTLMENAGRGVADFIQTKLSGKHRILVLCGTGNNGGDGFVAARYLAKHNTVSIFLAGETIKTTLAQSNFQKVKVIKKINVYSRLSELSSLIKNNDILIDALLGVGLSGTLKEPYSTIVSTVNSAKKKTVISVDVPTGFGTKLVVKPQYTVTFHDLKEGMTPRNSGSIHVVDIGIPKDAETYVGPGDLSVLYPRPNKESHKGDNGVVLVIGGGPYTGAPALSGMAVLRTGADLAIVATPKRAYPIVAKFSPNLVVKGLRSDVVTPADIPLITELLPRCHAVVIGPGLGAARETEDAITQLIPIITQHHKPLVIDADAIKPVGDHHNLIKHTPTVITPHGREFTKLTGVELPGNIMQRAMMVKEWAAVLDVSLFLKGYVDILSDGTHLKLNKVHNEGMTVGGTGDVLTGIIGALLSKGVTPFNAMRIAAFINGDAGNEAFKKKSYGLVATDILEEIPGVLHKYL